VWSLCHTRPNRSLGIGTHMKKRLLLGVVISVGLLLITEVSAAEPVRAPGQPTPPQSSAKEGTVEENAAEAAADIDWALQEVIGQVATAADEVGASDPAYTVSVVDVRHARLLVYRKSLTPDDFDVQKYVALAPAGVSIAFKAAALSATEIEHLSNLIAALSPEFRAVGIRLHGWGPTDYASGMHVLYTSDTPEVPRRLLERLEIYGPGTVTFKPGSVEGMANRQADTFPFAGGARIHGPYRDSGASLFSARLTSGPRAPGTVNTMK
jgi:hypothetical protein